MLSSLLLALAFEVGPFYEQRSDFTALRPFWSQEGETTDVLWPVFTSHRDWWRFCWFTHWQDTTDGGYQFEIIPFWFNGRDGRSGETYAGFFPFYGHHPHILTIYDFDFCLWPIWHRYRMPRPSEDKWMTSNAVLFPFVTWRDDGSWGFWPFYGLNHQRESDHRYALWPIVTWADYREDRDTAGAGTSWMFWPLYGRVDRARESEHLIIPPLFAYDETPDGWYLRCPWPIVEIERRRDRDRTSIFPIYERVTGKRYYDGVAEDEIVRYFWRLVELYYAEDGKLLESRVFPFWRKNDRNLRVWPFYDAYSYGGQTWHGVLGLFPITWVDSVDRNWSKFWTFYENIENPIYTEHSLFWGIIHWRTYND